MVNVLQSWSLSSIKKEASKYATKGEFYKWNLPAYQAAVRRGVLDDVCRHMAVLVRWDSDSLKLEAGKYPTRAAFRKGSEGAHKAARRLGLLDELFPVDKSVKG